MPRLLKVTKPVGLEPLTSQGRPVIASWDMVSAAFAALPYPLCDLLAEPVLGKLADASYTSIAWYTELPTSLGPRPTSLAPALVEVGKALKSLGLDAWTRHDALLLKVMCIPDSSGLHLDQDRLLLVNWGLVPPNTPKDGPGLHEHWRNVLAPLYGFMPPTEAFAALVAASCQEDPASAEPVFEAVGERGDGPINIPDLQDVAEMFATSSGLDADEGRQSTHAVVSMISTSPMVLISLSLVLGALCFFLASFVFKSQPKENPTVLGPTDGLDIQRETVTALQQRFESLQSLLAQDICKLPPSSIVPVPPGLLTLPNAGRDSDSPQPETAIPGNAVPPAVQQAAPASPESVPAGPGPVGNPNASPSSPQIGDGNQPPIPPASGGETPFQVGAPPAPGSLPTAPDSQPAASTVAEKPPTGPANQLPSIATLRQLMDQATVIVLVRKANAKHLGTAFFVTPKHLVTNRHLAVGATGGKVKVLNGQIRIQDATVKAISTREGQDYALLELINPVAGVKPLEFTSAVERTERVSAWGFPGMIFEDDPDFLRMLKGDYNAMPEASCTDGIVSHIRKSIPPVLIHTAVISQGNSGGPLVNECGQVVGINTAISFIGSESTRQLNLSLASSDIIKWLVGQGITPGIAQTSVSGPCQPNDSSKKASQ